MRNCMILMATFLMMSLYAQKNQKVSLDKNVTAVLPGNFFVMTDDDIARKYPSYRKPLAMYTNEDRLVDFGYNVTNGVWGNDIELLRKFYKSTINNTFTKVTFLKDTIIVVKKKPYIHLEYLSEVHDAESTLNTPKPPIKNYTYSVYTTEMGEVYIFNFNCPAKIHEKWKPKALEIANNIKVGKRTEPHEIKVIKRNNDTDKVKKK